MVDAATPCCLLSLRVGRNDCIRRSYSGSAHLGHNPLQDNYNCHGIEQYHGTGAFNLTMWPSWATLLEDMLGRPEDVIIVSAKRRGRGHGGWSKDNPYLEEVRQCQRGGGDVVVLLQVC